MQSSDKTKKLIRCTAWAITGCLAGLLIWFFTLYGRDIWNIFLSDNPSAAMEAFIRSLGGWGPFVLVLLQTLQIAIAFLPGEPVELAAGILYGGFWGAILCLVGVLIGSALVYWLVAKLGKNAIDAFHDGKSMRKFNSIPAFKQEKSAEILTFLLFLIPGIPKDFLTFAAPLTPMKPLRFLLISTAARAPGMFITTFAGESLLAGNFWMAAGLYGILFVGAVIGFFFYRRVTRERTDRP